LFYFVKQQQQNLFPTHPSRLPAKSFTHQMKRKEKKREEMNSCEKVTGLLSNSGTHTEAKKEKEDGDQPSFITILLCFPKRGRAGQRRV
jgi:hypothetical protein